MKLLSFVVAFSCVAFGSTSQEDKRKVDWQYAENGTTTFMAKMGVAWTVTFESTDNKTNQASLFFGNSSTANTTVSDGMMQLDIQESKNKLELYFKMEKGSYWLQNVTLLYTADNETFPDAKYHDVVELSANMAELFLTKENMSYSCSLESLVRLKSNETTVKSPYIQLTPPNKSSLQMQAFTFTDNSKFDEESHCLWDTRDLHVELASFDLKSNKTVCALLDTVLGLEVMYNTIDEKSMSTMIPLKNGDDVSGSCPGNNVSLTIHLKDDVGNVTLGFSVVNETYTYLGDVAKGVLDTIEFKYNPGSRYFPNHASTDIQTLRNASLWEFATDIGSSYNCYTATHVMVTSELQATFNRTHLQAFAVKDGKFSNVGADCQAKPAVNTTVPMKTTQVPATTIPVVPVPVDPTISNRTIKDKNMTCLIGEFGLQLYIMYNNTNGNMTAVGYNFDDLNITTVGECTADNATVTFERDDKVQIVMTFMKSDSKVYLSQISATYDGKNLPKHKEGSSVTVNATVEEFESPYNTSYRCSEGSDIFVSNAVDMVVIRMNGLKLEALPANGEKYAKANQCFQDLPAVAATSGDYFINSTSGVNGTVCAAFTMTVDAVVTYQQLVNGNPRTVYIAVPGKSNSPRDESFGSCNKDNTTTLSIPLENGKVVFNFTFRKQNISGSNYNYVMTDAVLRYATDSKYFPNHAHVAGNMVTLSNMSLSLFMSDESHSYKCSSNVTASLTDGKIFMADVQVQPFGVDKSDGSFSAALNCESGSSGLSRTALIAIYASIGVVCLVLLVGVGIFCRRRIRQRRLGYKTFD